MLYGSMASLSVCRQVARERGGLYVHVAFCRRKCLYCDFFSAGVRIADWREYVDALCAEFKYRVNEMACPFRSIYFGGGTPSLMPPAEFRRLCDHLKPYIGMVEEFTIEVNPDDVDRSILEVWKECGVNRISIGIQTFSDHVLKAIGRRHDSASARKAYRLSREYFDNVSVDLMFGLPGQSIEMWQSDLQEVVAMRPEHISAYSLMYEDGTALTALRDSGRIQEVAEETAESMFLLMIGELRKAGYDHYEISNFALPGFRSVHNSSYWLQKPYIGLGPSAHSYDGALKRCANRADLKGYLDFWTRGTVAQENIPCIMEEEFLSKEELIEEYVMTRLRTREGIPTDDFIERFGLGTYQRLIDRSLPLSKDGLLEITERNISLTEKAILLSDKVILELSDIL